MGVALEKGGGEGWGLDARGKRGGGGISEAKCLECFVFMSWLI